MFPFAVSSVSVSRRILPCMRPHDVIVFVMLGLLAILAALTLGLAWLFV
jgi:hypothetical protein